VTDQPRISTTPAEPDQALIHLPEFTYWDTQAWACELGVPVALLPGLRDAIDKHLGGHASHRREPSPACGEECAEGHTYAGRCTQAATLRCVCGDPVTRMDHPDNPGWIHAPGSDTPCLNARPRCPRCRMPHDLDGIPEAFCRSVTARIAVDDVFDDAAREVLNTAARTTPDNPAASNNETDNNRRALACNAIAPVLRRNGQWLPLNVRLAIADEVLAALDGPADTTPPAGSTAREAPDA
jgi:hypothetical protein